MAVANLESSSIKLKRHTGSAGVAPEAGMLAEGEFAINLIDGHLYYGGKGGVDISSSLALDNFTTLDTTFISGTRFDIEIPDTTVTGNLLISGNFLQSGSTFISGNTYITGDLVVVGTGSFDVFVTNYQSSSIIYSSGSTKFGDTQDDTHEFTGSVYITASEFNMDNHFVYKPNSYSLFVSGNITASNDISASDLHVTNISASGYISASGFFYDASATPPSLYVAGDISSSANISASGTVSSSKVYASTQGTFESANVKDISSTHIVYAGTNGELQGSSNLTFDGDEVTINGNLDVLSITSSVAISASHISGSSLVIDGNVDIIGTLSASNIQGDTFYSTKSVVDEPTPIAAHNLETYRVINFNPEIFITSSGTELIIQFGEPLTPTNLIGTLNGFNTNRFTGPGTDFPPTSTYVYDNYNVSFTYTLDESNTFISASLLSMSDGTVIEISKSEAADIGGSTIQNGLDYTTTFYINKDNSGPSGGATSGSQHFTASIHVTLQDLNKLSFDTTQSILGTLDKGDPGATRPSYDFSGMTGGGIYVSNNGTNNASNKLIEEGEQGSFTCRALAASNTNGWTNTSLDPSSNVTINVNSPTSTFTRDFEAEYSSNNLGEPTSIGPITNSDTFGRTQSLRWGVSPASSPGSGSGGFSVDELRNLSGWTSGDAIEGGQIDFRSTATSNNYTISNKEISMTSTVAGYIYIIYRSGLADLATIKQGTTDVTADFTVSTTGNYKIYKSGLKSPATFVFTLNPSS